MNYAKMKKICSVACNLLQVSRDRFFFTSSTESLYSCKKLNVWQDVSNKGTKTVEQSTGSRAVPWIMNLLHWGAVRKSMNICIFLLQASFIGGFEWLYEFICYVDRMKAQQPTTSLLQGVLDMYKVEAQEPTTYFYSQCRSVYVLFWSFVVEGNLVNKNFKYFSHKVSILLNA